MWAPRLFGQLVRLANKNATAASWCCAARVRESLADAGFVVTKAPGFGRKREMMTATLRPSLGRGFLARREAVSVLVVGGGIAGVGLVRGLAFKRHSCVVVVPVFDCWPWASLLGLRAARFTPLFARLHLTNPLHT